MIKKKWFRITRIVALAFLIAALVFASSPRGMSIVSNVVYAHPAAPTVNSGHTTSATESSLTKT